MAPLHREQLHDQVVAELRVRGSFEWSGIHFFVNKQGEIKRGLPW